MLNYHGIFLPDGEVHLNDWMDKMRQFRDGKPCYQLTKYDLAMRFVRRRRLAVDVGAHVGLWTRVIALDFERVEAFEPVPAHCECWKANMAGAANATLHELALGKRPGRVNITMRRPGHTGCTGVEIHEPGEIPVAPDVEVRTLDSYGFRNLDFLKVDNEGYEYFVMRGAVKTLLACRPIVIVEQKPGMGQRYGLSETAAVEYLRKLGARQLGAVGGDYIMGWQ